MRKISKLMLCMSAFAVVACGKSEKSVDSEENTANVETTDSTSNAAATAENTEQDLAAQKEAAKTIMTVALNLENASALEKKAEELCTPVLLRALREANEYEDGSVAWFALRTGYQDGPEDDSSILSVDKNGENEICVGYSDMGHHGQTILYFVKDEGVWKAHKAEQIIGSDKRTYGE